MKPPILFYSIDLAIWHGFRDITHIKVNKDRKSAILNMIKLNIFRAYLYQTDRQTDILLTERKSIQTYLS